MFQVFRDGAWLLDLTNGSMKRVLNDATAEEFTWAPDGRMVADHSRRSGDCGLWTMAARLSGRALIRPRPIHNLRAIGSVLVRVAEVVDDRALHLLLEMRAP